MQPHRLGCEDSSDLMSSLVSCHATPRHAILSGPKCLFRIGYEETFRGIHKSKVDGTTYILRVDCDLKNNNRVQRLFCK